MRSKLHASAVVEAAYDLRGSLASWAAGVVRAYEPLTEANWGAVSSLYSTDGKPVNLHFEVHEGPGVLRQACAMGERLAGRRWSDALVAGGLQDLTSMVPRMTAMARAFGLPLAATAICAPDGCGRGLFIGFPHRRGTLRVRQAATLAKATVPHVAAGLRLRRVLAEAKDASCAEAVLESTGRVVDASGAAREEDARAHLRDVVARRDRALAAAARARDDSDQSLWDPVVDGRWSLIDRIETDGRRYVVACPNPSGVLDPRRLTQAERDVARLAALGMSYKEIAGELGIKEGSVGPVLHAVTSKLGLPSPRHLPVFWRDAQQCVRAIAPDAGPPLYVAEGVPASPVRAELTPAEDAVLSLLVRGHSNAAIARARRTSTKTIANQVSALFRKLGVRSRQELMAQGAHGDAARPTAEEHETSP